jgi:hypothetical protein
LDPLNIAIVIIGAFAAGVTVGFAGFGMGLVSAGFWFHALPAAMVPPLNAITALPAQIVALTAIKKAFDWARAWPFLMGGVAGAPFGVAALAAASPDVLKGSVGLFLIAYALYQLSGANRWPIGDIGGRIGDGVIGFFGGFLGGFAGLPAPVPLIWVQFKGWPRDRQRAVYQPFNMCILIIASAGMAITGHITMGTLLIAAMCIPATLAGAWLGVKAYRGVSERAFKTIISFLLLLSGAVLAGQLLLGS